MAHRTLKSTNLALPGYRLSENLWANTLENAISYSSSFMILLDMSCPLIFCDVDIRIKEIIHESE